MGPQYYRHSGTVPPAGAVTGLAAGGIAGAVLAGVYAYADVYIPIAGYVTFILSGGFGFLTGLAVAWGLKRGKVRNGAVGLLLAAAVTAFAYYVSWGVWLYATLRRADVQDVGLTALLLNPLLMWSVVGKINEVGAWSIKSFTPTGLVLWLFWGLEAAIVFGASLLAAAAALGSEPFCERCEAWCPGHEGVARLATADREEVKRRVEAGDLAFLRGLGPVPAGATSWLQLDLHACPSCESMTTLTVKAVEETTNSKGETQRSSKDVVDKLLLASADAAKVRELGQASPPAVTQ